MIEAVISLFLILYSKNYMNYNIVCTAAYNETINITNTSIPLSNCITLVGDYCTIHHEASLGSFLSIISWMTVSGTTTFVFSFIKPIIHYIISFLEIKFHYDVYVKCDYYKIYGIFNLFTLFFFAWTITGAVLFWRDCKNLQPQNVNTFMWICLISWCVCICYNSHFAQFMFKKAYLFDTSNVFGVNVCKVFNVCKVRNSQNSPI
jgi:hypothetical protein